MTRQKASLIGTAGLQGQPDGSPHSGFSRNRPAEVVNSMPGAGKKGREFHGVSHLGGTPENQPSKSLIYLVNGGAEGDLSLIHI